jgi:DNA-binding cell septation regulator SpoVG
VTAPITILAIRKLAGNSTVKAFVDLQIGGVTIKGAKIVQQDGQKAWLAMPSIKTERDWQNVVELSKPLRDKATEVVLAAWVTHQPRDLPIRGGRQAHERGDEIADAWAKRQRDEHVQELARRFDEREPDEVPW